MSEYKYIMFEDPDTGRKTPVIFPGSLVHADVARALQVGGCVGYSEPVSAGMVQIVATATCQRSESMDLDPAESDRLVINTHNYTGGVETGMEDRIEKLLLVRTAELIISMAKRG